jgi:hypothetical protein
MNFHPDFNWAQTQVGYNACQVGRVDLNNQ